MGGKEQMAGLGLCLPCQACNQSPVPEIVWLPSSFLDVTTPS